MSESVYVTLCLSIEFKLVVFLPVRPHVTHCLRPACCLRHVTVVITFVPLIFGRTPWKSANSSIDIYGVSACVRLLGQPGCARAESSQPPCTAAVGIFQFVVGKLSVEPDGSARARVARRRRSPGCLVAEPAF